MLMSFSDIFLGLDFKRKHKGFLVPSRSASPYFPCDLIQMA